MSRHGDIFNVKSLRLATLNTLQLNFILSDDRIVIGNLNQGTHQHQGRIGWICWLGVSNLLTYETWVMGTFRSIADSTYMMRRLGALWISMGNSPVIWLLSNSLHKRQGIKLVLSRKASQASLQYLLCQFSQRMNPLLIRLNSLHTRRVILIFHAFKIIARNGYKWQVKDVVHVDNIWETAKFFWNAAIQTVVVHVPASHNHVSVSVLVIEILEG